MGEAADGSSSEDMEGVESVTQLASMGSFTSVFEKALQSGAFIPDGGVIGFPCTHTYVQAVDDTTPLDSTALKGINSLIFTAFRHLNHPVTLHRVVSEDARPQLERYMSNYSGGCYQSPYVIVVPVFDENDTIPVPDMRYLEVLILKDAWDKQSEVVKIFRQAQIEEKLTEYVMRRLENRSLRESQKMWSSYERRVERLQKERGAEKQGEEVDDKLRAEQQEAVDARLRQAMEANDKLKEAMESRFVVDPINW
ncbi:hypothetical protein HDV00_011284 [Rhizophlyctis rosea]|nr:hypothetical protein HDV00_011284 [Rhizophlyctis rosea]